MSSERRYLTDGLRAHPFATLVVSVALVLVGGWLVFSDQGGDLSGADMLINFGGFVAFCVGLVGVMIIVLRPLPFSADDAASWEVTRARGRTKFLALFVLFSSPVLLGALFGAWRGSEGSLGTVTVITVLFLGLALLAGSELWKYFEHRHSQIARSEASRGEDDKTI